jgi:RND family efflux transporter MFP subunit
MSRPVSRVRRGIEIAAAALILIVVFVWVQGFMRAKVGPGDGATSHGMRYDGPAAAAEVREIPVRVEAVGTVRAVNEASIAARVMGVVERIDVDEGDRVRRGQMLIVVSAPELAARGEAARQAIAAAEASLLQARSDFQRMEALLAKEAATRVEWERARTALAVAEAELSRARQAARAEEAMASYTDLTAPFDGRVVERRMDPGDLASPGAPILRLVDDRSFQIEASVDETRAAALEKGAPVVVRLEPSGRTVSAAISEVVPASDPASRTVLVKALLPAAEGIHTGQFARLEFATGGRMALVVPRSALRRVGGLDLVHVVDAEGFTTSRYVRPGAAAGEEAVEILSGLTAGERVALELVADHD